MEVIDQSHVDQHIGGWGFKHALRPASPITMHRAWVHARAAILVAGFTFSISADAVGLGALRLQSALGQPLLAQLTLVSPNDGDLEKSCYKAKVVTLDGTFLGNGMIDLKVDGPTPAILISTSQIINEPALDVHVEFTCGANTRRDYQVLLDFVSLTPPVIEAQHVGVAPVAVEKHATGSAAPLAGVGIAPSADATAPIKKSKHHHLSTEIKSSTEYAAAPKAVVDEVKPKRHKKTATKTFRSVLRLAGDDDLDAGLNDTTGVRLSLSHNLSGSNAAVDTNVPPGVQIGKQTPATAATPAASATATPATAAPVNPVEPASPASGNANAATNTQTADAVLQDLQAKIRVLEAETNELKKLNAQHILALKTAQTEKEGGNALLYLYFLLFSSFVAIGWLVWRTRQIQFEMTHSSWHDIVPEQMPDDETPSADIEEDVFLGQDDYPSTAKNIKPLKSVPKPAAVDAVEVAASVSSPLPAKPAAAAAIADDSSESDYKFQSNNRSALPNAEEILDEIQQAEFWMDMQQPQRAIEILESNWSVERPNSPLPWLYLFDLYRLVGDQEKYNELTERFGRIFNCQVQPWGDGQVVLQSRSLEEFPALMKKLVELWSTEDLVPFLENLLVDDRDGRRQGFDLASYREILFLTNIAYDIQGSKGISKAPLYVPEWSTHK